MNLHLPARKVFLVCHYSFFAKVFFPGIQIVLRFFALSDRSGNKFGKDTNIHFLMAEPIIHFGLGAGLLFPFGMHSLPLVLLDLLI